MLKVNQPLKSIELNTDAIKNTRRSLKKRKLHEISSEYVLSHDEYTDDEPEDNDNDKQNTENSFNLTKKRINWNDDECLFLVYGVRKFGFSSWSEILKSFQSRFHEKRNVTFLAAKYDYMVRNNQVAKYAELIERFSMTIETAVKNNTYQSILYQTLIDLHI